MHYWSRPFSAPLTSTFTLKLPTAFALLLVLTTTALADGATDVLSALPKFSQVNERLYRGAQPRRGGLGRLAGLGVKTVINLRGAGALTRAEEAEAAALGLRYFNIPMPVWGRPEDGRVQRILEILGDPENGSVFIHCKDGVDRTGTIVALYRITVEGWSAEAATAEALSRGMRRTQVWMRDYIEDFYDRRVGEVEAAGMRYHDGRGVEDKLGSYVSDGERAAFKAQRLLRRAPGSLRGVFARVF